MSHSDPPTTQIQRYETTDTSAAGQSHCSGKYTNRESIEQELYRHLNSNDMNDLNKINGSKELNQVTSILISGPRNFGKTTLISTALKQKKIPYIYLDFHGLEMNDNSFISALEDNMNDPKWYRLLMRKLHPNYNQKTLDRWITSIRTLITELEHRSFGTSNSEKSKDSNSELSLENVKDTDSAVIGSSPSGAVPWIVIDGLEIHDVLKNKELKQTISTLNQQLCTDFGTAPIVLSVTSESPTLSQRVFSKEMDHSLWIGQFESRQCAFGYLKSKLNDIGHIGDGELQNVIDFCRLNIDDLNYCIDQIRKIYETNFDDNFQNDSDGEVASDSHQPQIRFSEFWEEIKQKRLEHYKSQGPLSDWSDIGYWKHFVDEMKIESTAVSRDFELNACKYLLFDYFTSVVVVGCTAHDIVHHFAGNTDIVNTLYEEGCLSQYGSLVVPPFNLYEEAVLMPSSRPQFLAFEQLLKENVTVSNLALYCSRHYIFTRELNRAQRDLERIKAEREVFESAQQYVDQQKKELSMDQRAHLEVEILNKTKSFDTKMV